MFFAAAFFVSLTPSHGAETQYAEELIFEVILPPYRVSPGVFAYELEGRYYLPLLELAESYDFYTEAELARGYVRGWSVEPTNSFSIDTGRQELIIRGAREALSPDAVLAQDDLATEDMYVSVDLLRRIWPLNIDVDLSKLLVVTETKEGITLPFELKLKRKKRQEALDYRLKARKEKEELPFKENPYRLLSPPVIDLEATSSYDNSQKLLSGSVGASGLMHLGGFITDFSGAYRLDRDGRIERPDSIRFRMRREAYGDENIWRTGLKSITLGDVNIRQRDLVSSSFSGRGLFVSNAPVDSSNEFDRITIEGLGIPGWEIELYLNETLIDFGVVDSTGEYRFEDVVLQYGNNNIRVVLYGPQGQIREDVRNYNFSGVQRKPGEFRYDVGFLDSGRALILLDNDPRSRARGVAKTANASYGLSRDFTVFGGVTDIPTNEGDKRYVTGGGAFSLLNSSIQAEGYKEVNGGNALDFRLLTELFGLQLNLRTSFFNDFESPDANSGDNAKTFESEAQVNARIPMFYFGKMGLRFNLNHREIKSGAVSTDLTTNQTVSKKGLVLTHTTRSNFLNEIHETSNGAFNANYNFRDWQVRGALSYLIHPESELASFQSTLRYSDSEDPFQFAVTARHDFQTTKSKAGIQLGYEFDKFLGSFDIDYAESQGWTMTTRASSSLSPFNDVRQYEFSSRPQRKTSPLLARAFLDHDNNGIYNEGDEPIENVKILASGRRSTEGSNENGYVSMAVGSTGVIDVKIDEASLEDPYYKSAKKGYSTIPLPGTMPTFEFPILETGIVEGFVTYKSDERPVQGMIIQLVDERGEVAMESETAYDGYYAFEFVLPGTYTVRANPEYEVNVPPETVTVTSEDLFLYGIDLFLLEQADEVGATDGNPDVAGGEKSGDVAQTNHSTGTQPAPISSDSDFDAVVKYVRIGEYPGKGRLVLDLSGPVDDYSVMLSDDGQAVLVDLPDVGWDADGLPDTTSISMIEGLNVEPLETGKTGTRIRINTSKLVTVGQHGILPPSERWGTGYRLYLDVLTEDE